MPYFAGPVADERDALLTFLAVPRAALRAAVFGLTDEQAVGSQPGAVGPLGALPPDPGDLAPCRARRHHPRGARRQARRPTAGCLRSRIDGSDPARNSR